MPTGGLYQCTIQPLKPHNINIRNVNVLVLGDSSLQLMTWHQHNAWGPLEELVCYYKMAWALLLVFLCIQYDAIRFDMFTLQRIKAPSLFFSIVVISTTKHHKECDPDVKYRCGEADLFVFFLHLKRD